MSVGKYLPGVIKCKMNSYWSTSMLKVWLAPPPIIDKRDVPNARQCSTVIELYWSNLSNHQTVNWHRSDLLTHFAFLFIPFLVCWPHGLCVKCWLGMESTYKLCVFSQIFVKNSVPFWAFRTLVWAEKSILVVLTFCLNGLACLFPIRNYCLCFQRWVIKKKV